MVELMGRQEKKEVGMDTHVILETFEHEEGMGSLLIGGREPFPFERKLKRK